MNEDDAKYPSELAERFQLRLPDGMRDRIKAAAEAKGRSMNAELVAVLMQNYPERPHLAGEWVQVSLFMPAELKAHLEAAAGRNRRTLAEEMVERLDNSFSSRSPSGDGFGPDNRSEVARVAAQEAANKMIDWLSTMTPERQATLFAAAGGPDLTFGNLHIEVKSSAQRDEG
ncbi:Arc family DNA-binding protein [Cereibacter azotoformans]|uniref:Arc family DNA-binding protein n=1 Tax=Cereibacter azotoformans TaxID=43057 RepID=UPI001EEC3792|nr:Arc family DNA-binding protein [Cereibacter azotoformans]ULB09132.1 Arc family DNA-binding protein [Cereibacter azotoformans]